MLPTCTGARRHGQGGRVLASPWKCCKVFLCISSYSKIFSRRIIYALFYNQSSASGGLTPDSHRGSISGPRWGTFVPRTLICPPLEKNPASAHAYMFNHSLSLLITNVLKCRPIYSSSLKIT